MHKIKKLSLIFLMIVFVVGLSGCDINFDWGASAEKAYEKFNDALFSADTEALDEIIFRRFSGECLYPELLPEEIGWSSWGIANKNKETFISFVKDHPLPQSVTYSIEINTDADLGYSWVDGGSCTYYIANSTITVVGRFTLIDDGWFIFHSWQIWHLTLPWVQYVLNLVEIS